MPSLRIAQDDAAPSGTAASAAVAKQLGVGRESARRWVVQAQVDGGQRQGASSAGLNFHNSEGVFGPVKVPTLLPLLRSQVQGDMLALLFLNPAGEFSLTEVARSTGATLSGVHHEVTRLLHAGLVGDRRVGNTRLVRADTSSLLAGPLTDLLAVTYGPRPVLSNALRGVPGVERAFIYGSWAARYSGAPGPVPNDIDLLVVGTADLDDLEDAVRAASEQLRREINIRRVAAGTWVRAESGDDASAFLATVIAARLVALDLEDADRPPSMTGAPR